MSNFVPKKVFLRGVLLHYFNMKKTTAESDFGLEDEERPGQPKQFEDEELEALLDEDCCQTQEQLAESLGVTQAAISKRLKAAGYI